MGPRPKLTNKNHRPVITTTTTHVTITASHTSPVKSWRFGNFQGENKKFCWVFWLHKSWMVTKLCDGYNSADGYKIGCGSLIAFSSNSPTQVFGDVLSWMSRWIAVAQTSIKQGCTKTSFQYILSLMLQVIPTISATFTKSDTFCKL